MQGVGSGVPDLFGEDGLRGPVGETFSAALRGAGEALGFDVRYPRAFAPWVDQEWNGRHLIVRWSTIGSQATTTGYRWIAIRLATARLGSWADEPRPDADRLEGVRLVLTPRPPSAAGVWTEAPGLSAALWDLVTDMCPWGLPDDLDEQQPWVQLHVRNDGVIWHVRAQLLDEDTLTRSIQLLAEVADWAETNDEVLSERLGTAPGVVAFQRLERGIVVWAILLAVLAGFLPLLLAVR
jgi:hypothetical protein